MNYIDQQRLEKERYDEYLTQILGPPPINPAIKNEQELRELDERLRTAMEPKAKKWDLVRGLSRITAMDDVLD